jgi:hypothetical protein
MSSPFDRLRANGQAGLKLVNFQGEMSLPFDRFRLRANGWSVFSGKAQGAKK